MHAAHAYAIEHPESFGQWHRDSNTIVILEAADADTLDTLRARAISAAIPVSAFTDDDIDSRLTSIALGPGNRARKLCWGLPLAMQPRKEAA